MLLAIQATAARKIKCFNKSVTNSISAAAWPFLYRGADQPDRGLGVPRTFDKSSPFERLRTDRSRTAGRRRIGSAGHRGGSWLLMLTMRCRETLSNAVTFIALREGSVAFFVSGIHRSPLQALPIHPVRRQSGGRDMRASCGMGSRKLHGSHQTARSHSTKSRLDHWRMTS
jgi:hypothetical protein